MYCNCVIDYSDLNLKHENTNFWFRQELRKYCKSVNQGQRYKASHISEGFRPDSMIISIKSSMQTSTSLQQILMKSQNHIRSFKSYSNTSKSQGNPSHKFSNAWAICGVKSDV